MYNKKARECTGDTYPPEELKVEEFNETVHQIKGSNTH